MKTPYSLKDQTLAKIAIQICQYPDLKNHILNTPKQVQAHHFFWIGDILPYSKWADFITEQSSSICEKILPHAVKASLILRIRETAIRMINWYKEQELRLEMTPHVVDQFLMTTDWTVQGTIDERKVAERLVQERTIPVPQRYRLACLYFLEAFIRPLLDQISPKERSTACYHETLFDYDNILNIRTCIRLHNHAKLNLVWLWSHYLQGKLEEFIGREDLFWQRGFEIAVTEGKMAAVTYCWKALSEIQKQETIITAALSALREYCTVRCIPDVIYQNTKYGVRKKGSIEYWEYVRISKMWCAVPEHYRDIFNFLFSKMSEEQKFEFFQNAFDVNSSVLQSFFKMSFIRWPNTSMLVQGVSKLWGILPAKYFKRFLFNLFNSNINIWEYQDCEKEHLLLELLENTPDRYKTYLFRDKKERIQYEDNVDLLLLLKVFKHNPIEQINIELIQIILEQATVQEKRALMHSNCGSEICVYFMKNRKLEVVDLIIGYCLPEVERPDFKKEFLTSHTGLCLCLKILAQKNKQSFEIQFQENEEFVNSIFQWGYLSETDILDIKPKIIRAGAPEKFLDLQDKKKFDCFYKIEEYCLPSADAQKEFRKELCTLYSNAMSAKITNSCQYETLNLFLSSSFVGENDIKFLSERNCTELLKNILWEISGADAENEEDYRQCETFFVKWLGNSPMKLAMDLVRNDIIMPRIREKIFQLLQFEHTESAYIYLKWYVSDIESAMSFKKEFEKYVTENKYVKLNYDTKQRILRMWEQLMEDQKRDPESKRKDVT